MIPTTKAHYLPYLTHSNVPPPFYSLLDFSLVFRLDCAIKVVNLVYLQASTCDSYTKLELQLRLFALASGVQRNNSVIFANESELY